MSTSRNMKLKILITVLCLLSCSAKTTYTTSIQWQFQTINYEKPFKLTVDKFTKNDAYCFTEAIPYAVAIGKTNAQDLPKKLSVLLYCDNNLYHVGQILKIQPIIDPTKNTTLNPLYLVRDTLINGQKVKFLIGTENLVIWGKVVKDK